MKDLVVVLAVIQNAGPLSVHNEFNNSAYKVVNCWSVHKSYQLQKCKQMLSVASCAHKSYRSSDAILRFFSSIE